MDKIKKLWKEISVFGIVIVVFLALFIYRKVMFAEYTTISETKVVEMMKDKDNFVVVVGSSSDNTTLNYQSVMKTFVDKNRNQDLYFVDLKNNTDATKYVSETFSTEETALPQTFVIKDGKVASQHAGVLSYYRLTELYKK